MQSFGRCEITLESDLADEKRRTHFELTRSEGGAIRSQTSGIILGPRRSGAEELIGLIASPVSPGGGAPAHD